MGGGGADGRGRDETMGHNLLERQGWTQGEIQEDETRFRVKM